MSGTRVVVNLATPKQARFFPPLVERLRKRGCEVFVLSRRYAELDLLVESLGIDAEPVGEHGGGTKLGKLLASAERIRALALRLDELRPDVVVSWSNPEMARAAFGLGLPLASFADLPESGPAARLALPLATAVFAPWVVPKAEFARFGHAPEDVFHYEALDPAAWLEDLPVDRDVPARLGLDPARPIVVCRETEWQASYARGEIVAETRDALARRYPDWQLVDVPRYAPHPYYDVPSLLAAADLLLGGGGTMCIEAAWYGTPVVATRALDCHYMRWLAGEGHAVEASTPEAALAAAERAVLERESDAARAARERSRARFAAMRFPFDALIDRILALAR